MSNDHLVYEQHEEKSKRLPVPYKESTIHAVEIVNDAPPTRSLENVQEQVKQVQRVTAARPITVLRRLLFVWLRIYVHETKRGQNTHVNLAIPIPIPLIGALLKYQLTWNQAMQVVDLAQDDAANYAAIESLIESCMGLELIRVQEEKTNKQTMVVIGLD
jgi:hypothetical protein